MNPGLRLTRCLDFGLRQNPHRLDGWCRFFRITLWLLFCSCSCEFMMAQNTNSENPKADDRVKSLWTRQQGVDWAQFLGPTANGISTETGIEKDWKNGNLKVMWKMDLGEGYGIGSVAVGRYIQFDRHQGLARVRCVNAETGEPLWNFKYESEYRDLYGYDSGPRASPVIEGNRVYLYGVEGIVHCLSLANGEEVWNRNLSDEFGVIQNFFGVASTPVLFEDLLLLMVGGSPPEAKKIPPGRLDVVEANGSGIVALDKMTGEVKYKSIDDLASYSTIRVGSLPFQPDQPVGLAWMRDGLFGFDPKSGATFFEFPYRSRNLESVNAAMPIVVGNRILLSECYSLGSVLLDLENNKPKVVWSDADRGRNKSMEAHWNTPIYLDGKIYGCSGRHSNGAELRCVDWETGDVHWSNDEFTRSSLTLIDGHFILLDESGQLALFKPSADKFDLVTQFDGGPTRIKFRKPCWAAPIVSHGLMYVRGANQVVCFELIKE